MANNRAKLQTKEQKAEYKRLYNKEKWHTDECFRLKSVIYAQLYRALRASYKPHKNCNYLGIKNGVEFVKYLQAKLAIKYPHLQYPRDYGKGKGKLLELNHIKSLVTAYEEGGSTGMIAAAHYTNIELELITVNRAGKKGNKYKMKNFKRKGDLVEKLGNFWKVSVWGERDDPVIGIFDDEYPMGKFQDIIAGKFWKLLNTSEGIAGLKLCKTAVARASSDITNFLFGKRLKRCIGKVHKTDEFEFEFTDYRKDNYLSTQTHEQREERRRIRHRAYYLKTIKKKRANFRKILKKRKKKKS